VTDAGTIAEGDVHETTQPQKEQKISKKPLAHFEKITSNKGLGE